MAVVTVIIGAFVANRAGGGIPGLVAIVDETGIGLAVGTDTTGT
jgi:hypothetical protein